MLAVLVGAAGLAAYVRTLAPDVLYGDSAEFQALPYTFGLAHSTGYPIYLLLARLVGVIPLGTPAWRINLFSALSAALVLSFLYLSARYLSGSISSRYSRFSAVLSCLALGLSYTLWSQAVVAEVYTPGAAFSAAVIWLLWRWGAAPARRSRELFLAALLAGLGIGVHATVGLLAPAAVVTVLLTLWVTARQGRQPTRLESLLAGLGGKLRSILQDDAAYTLRKPGRAPARQSAGLTAPEQMPATPPTPAPPFRWQRQLLAAGAGALLGVALLCLSFYALDRVNSPTSFNNVMLYPSRAFWRLTPADLDSPFERIWLTLSSVQWRDMMFPAGNKVIDEQLPGFMARTWSEFSLPMGLLSLLGLFVTLRSQPRLGLFLVLASLGILTFALNYPIGDQFVFFLSNHVLVALALAPGAGFVLEQIHPIAPGQRQRSAFRAGTAILAAGLLLALVVWPTGAARWQALRAGRANFIEEDYHYPLENPGEPRLVGTSRLLGLPDNAVLVLDWRALYTTAYIACVERGKTGLWFYEAMPYGNDGQMASTLIELITEDLQEGRPVYADQVYPGLRENFRVMPFGGSDLYKVSLRNK